MPQLMQWLKAMISDVPRYDSASRIDLQRVGRVGAHGDLGDVDVAVGHGDHAQVLLAAGLAAGGELGHRAAGRRLRGLPARVGIDLRIEHQEIDVAAGGEDVVDAAEADVVGPAVAAEAPHAAADEILGRGRQVLGVAAADGRQPLLQGRHQRALQGDLGVGLLLVLQAGP